MTPHSRPFFSIRWIVVAVLAVSITLIPVLLFQSSISVRFLAPPFLLAVLISAWLGGVLSGLLAAVISTLVIDFFLVPPIHIFHTSADDIERLASYLIVSILIAVSGTARNRSERKAQEFNAVWQAAIKASPMAMLVVNRDLKVSMWNPAAERLFGLSETEALDNPMSIVTGEPETFDSLLEARFQSNNVRSFNTSQSRKNGALVEVNISSAALRDSEGMITGVLLIMEEITDRKRLDRELRQSENRFRSFMDHLPGFAWIKDSGGGFVYMNRQLQEVLANHRDDWIGRGDFDLWPPEIAAEYRRNDRQVIESGKPLQVVETWDKEGEVHHLLVSKFPIVDASGGVLVGGASFDITERMRTEQALGESQAHLQAILDNCPAMIFLKSVEGRYLNVNRQLERTFDLASEQIVGRSDEEVFGPELAAAFRASDRRVLESGRSIELEELARYSDGLHTNIVHKFPLKDALGNIYAVGGIATDITARKLEEDQLRRQKEVLQKIFDHIPVLISFIGKDDRFKLVNREWERTLGWSLEEIVDQEIDVLHEQYPDREDYQNVVDLIANANGKWSEFRTRARDGRMIDTAWASVRLSDGTSIGIGQDVTEQKRAQEALQESHNFQRAVVEASPDAIFAKDREGRYQMINSAGASFIGKPVEEIIGRYDSDLLPGETGGSEIMRWDQEVMSSGRAETFEETAAGRTFLTTKDVYRDSKGTVVGLIGIARDITERKQAEEKLKEYEKAVEGLKDMIVVVDCDYRYLLANRAYLNYRGLEREQLVGRLASEVLGEEVFEEVVKPMVDECLKGKAVNYEGKFTFPRIGVRDLFVSYFPVEGPDGVDRVTAILRDITEHKCAEEALRESEERFSRAFHSSPAALAISSLEDGRLVEVNNAFVELTGYSQIGALGRTCHDLELWVVPEHRSEMARALHERGPVRDLETRFRKKSGEVRDVVLSVEMIDLRAKPCVLVIVQDVTDRKRNEEALRASQERYRDLVENAHDIIYAHDLDGNYTSVNRAVEQITGYSREEILRMNFAQILSPKYLELARSMIRQKLEGETETVYDLEIVAKDGRAIAFEVNTRLIRQDGEAVGIHGIARDVTERKRAQEELRESEERYRDLVENSTELICTHDLNGLILSANRSAIEVLGYDSNDYLGRKNVRDFLAPEFRSEFPDYLARIRANGVASGLMLVQTKFGERRIWEYRNTLRTEGVVKPIVRGMARDITERMKAEEQLKATTDQLRALSASLRSAREEEGTRIARELHDELGSSLTGLRFDLEEVQKSLSEFEGDTAISTLQEKVASMTRLTDGTINTVKRISSELRPSLLDDLGLVAAIEWEAQQFVARSGIPCRCHCLAETIDLNKERATAVFRVFQEALTNILRHANATMVNVTIAEEEAELVLEVRDDGGGITEAERTDPRSLGLTGMRERVHLAGGTIEITGAAGMGTILTVRVPGKA